MFVKLEAKLCLVSLFCIYIFDVAMYRSISLKQEDKQGKNGSNYNI